MWLLLILLSVLLLGSYGWLIENYRRWFVAIKPFVALAQITSETRFSVIIPARNETENIKRFLPSILHQNYPAELFEVIVINDHSTDDTANTIQVLQQQYSNLKLINLHELLGEALINSYKKKAIELAIDGASGDWIVTTDADCLAGSNWLKSLDSFIQANDVAFVAAPVKIISNQSFLSIFQSLDFISLQGITAAAVHYGFHSMCNGANLAYRKQVFNEVGGFAGIDAIASGDDMLLMHKIYLQHPTKVKFLLSAEAIIETTPMYDWMSFLNQRIRWASKADTYKDKRIFKVLAFVYGLNLFLFILFFVAFFNPRLWLVLLGLIVLKTMIELQFMQPVARFFGEENLLRWFGWMQPLHITYTVVAGWLGKFGSYQWKGRRVK